MIQSADSFRSLVTAAYPQGGNALCWRRTLAGDFAEVAAKLGPGEGIVSLNEERLLALPGLSEAGRTAVAVMLEDMRLLRAEELAPELNAIYAYPRDEAAGAVATDVLSWHVDSATERADTWLCTYHGAPSEGLRNDQAIQRVKDPATRAALLREFAGADDADFAEWLRDNCYDLHYSALPGAQPWSFGVGHLWRVATEYPDSPVLPCIHRAPTTMRGQPPRLLLIA